MTDSEIITKFLEGVKKAILANMARADQIVSGQTANSLEVVGNSLLGKKYIGVLETGRKAGKMPPVSNILAWVQARGIIPEKGTQEGLAFGIAKKIGLLGSKLYRDGGRKDIITSEISDEKISILQKQIAEKYFNLSRATVIDSFNK